MRLLPTNQTAPSGVSQPACTDRIAEVSPSNASAAGARRSPVFGTVALESGAQKPISTIFCGDPQKAVAIGRQAIDGKIFKPIYLPEGTKRILLRWQACGTFQQANQRPE
jgi:hypothetical protein